MTDPARRNHSELLSLTREGLGALFGYIDEAVVCCEGDGTIRFASAGLRPLLGLDPDSVVGHDVLEFLHEDDRERVAEGLARWQDRSGAPRGEVVRVRAADETWRLLRYDTVVGTPVGSLGTIIVTLRDVADADVDARERQYQLLSSDCLVRVASAFVEAPYGDFDEGLALALSAMASLEWVTRVSVWLVDHPRGDRVVLRGSWTAPSDGPRVRLSRSARIADFRFLRATLAGEEVHLSMSWDHGEVFRSERTMMEAAGTRSVLAVPLQWEGAVTGLVMLESTVADIAFSAVHTSTLRSAAAILAGAFVRHEAEVRLAAQARTDGVTGLGNRWAFDAALDVALHDIAQDRSAGFGLALVDLDRFKLVNDTHGHATGDRVLRDVAGRLRGAADDRTEVARLGGDELLVLVDRSGSVRQTMARVEHLVDSLAAPFDVGGGEVMPLTASVGVVHNDEPDVPGPELLRRADLAMYRAKALGGHTVQLDDPAQWAGEWSRLHRESELRQAVRDDDLTVHYQGEWDLVTGELVGAEALVRWEHPTDGLLAAGEFVPLAEERGLIDELGRQVLREACQAAAPWIEALGDRFTLRVNLAADQLRHRDLPDQVADTLSDAGLPADALCLELTESTLLADPAGSALLFDQLREQGVGLAIDDFGTGYSSMVQLKQLPITALKIDRSFVAGLPHADVDHAIVRSTIQLADAMGVSVTAEGVETEEQREALVDLGCRRAQGYLMARPESAAAFGERVRAQVSS